MPPPVDETVTARAQDRTVGTGSTEGGAPVVEVEIAAITVGTRYRKDLGHLEALVESIRQHGLLQPIGVTRDGALLFGARRLAACRQLGWTRIPVRILDVDALWAEHAENVVRQAFAPSEAVAIGEALEARERERGRENRGAAGPASGRGAKGRGVPQPKGKTRDRVAKVVGMSGRSYEKARVVVQAAKTDPTLQPLVEEMDRTGNINRAYRTVKESKSTTPPRASTTRLTAWEPSATDTKAAQVPKTVAKKAERVPKTVAKKAEREATTAVKNLIRVVDALIKDPDAWGATMPKERRRLAKVAQQMSEDLAALAKRIDGAS